MQLITTSCILEKKKINLIFTRVEQSSKLPIWIICPMDINEKHCSLPKEVKNYVILKENEFNSINLKLVQNKSLTK